MIRFARPGLRAWLGVVGAALVCASSRAAPPVEYDFQVVAIYPHDARAFTQGLVYVKGELYESTGLRGQSSLRRVDLRSGKVLQIRRLPARLFAEGLAELDDKLIQLTWRAGVGFVYDRASFAPLGQFRYATEGWGLTHDGHRLIMSDGSARLYYLDARSHAPLGTVEVRDDRGPVTRLNELEFVDGFVFANVWGSDRIAKIALPDGRVSAWIDLTELRSLGGGTPVSGVLNGIAHDPTTGHLYVTGKNWPRLYEIALERAGG